VYRCSKDGVRLMGVKASIVVTFDGSWNIRRMLLVSL
jgi:hypothetical protein